MDREASVWVPKGFVPVDLVASANTSCTLPAHMPKIDRLRNMKMCFPGKCSSDEEPAAPTEQHSRESGEQHSTAWMVSDEHEKKNQGLLWNLCVLCLCGCLSCITDGPTKLIPNPKG